MSVVWTSRYRKNTGREGVGKGGRMQNASSFSVGCHGHGELLPFYLAAGSLTCSISFSTLVKERS